MRELPITIREANVADLPAVRALLVETWHDTYDALIGVEKVTEITNSWHSVENLARQLTMPETSFLIAESDDGLVGHAFANAQRPPLVDAEPPLRAPVKPAAGNRNAIDRRGDHPSSGLRRDWLEVEADNAKGFAFYRKIGLEVVGEKRVEGIDHVVMQKRLAPSS